MAKKKSFDCVEMKNEIQTRHARENAGLTDEEVFSRIAERLATSDDPIARKWRAIGERDRKTPTGP